MIGTKFYKYDNNKRVYTDPDTGEKSPGAPFYKHSFWEYFVVGETTKSWMLSRNKNASIDSKTIMRVPKKALFEEYGYLTEEMKANAIWGNENRYRIENEVRRVSVNMLKKIDALLKENAR